MEAYRVDAETVTDSVLTDILKGIGSSRLVFADLSTVGLDAQSSRHYRNANVMYEVGIATAVRQPAEILAFRSDSDSLPFDIANVRVRVFASDIDESAARAQSELELAFQDALREVDTRRSLAVDLAARLIDEATFSMLFALHSKPTGVELESSLQEMPMVARVSAQERLLSNGLMEVVHPSMLEEGTAATQTFRYQRTPLGEAVFQEVKGRLRFREWMSQNDLL